MRLQDFQNAAGVPQFRCAITPGKHCPLFGVAAALRCVAGITLIYIGTQDCVYYAQKDALTSQLTDPEMRDGHFRTLAVELSDSDLIFGIRPQLEKLLLTEAARADTRAIYLVTSCSVEVLSEDLQSITRTVSNRTGKKVHLIPTENFKTFSYYQGIEDALEALTDGLEPCPKIPKRFAVLGVRCPGARESEPVRYLLSRGYCLHSVLPYDTDLDRIEALPSVEFTLVLEGSGLAVARSLWERFHIPFVRFDRMLHLPSVLQAWEELSRITGEDLTQWITEQRDQTEALAREVSAAVAGKTFFYGQKVLYPFETCLFLAKLGMTPTCIFLGSSMDGSDDCRRELLNYGDPVMWQNASHAALGAMLEQQPPDFVIGLNNALVRCSHAKAVRLQTKPIRVGFEYYRMCLLQIQEAAKGDHDT